MSGGVDSSVAAALLVKAGYKVTGVFIKVWQPDFSDCNWKKNRLDAMRVCALLNIPLITLGLEKIYKKFVIRYMLDEYDRGLTPNPDVMCNKQIKFGAFYDWAKSKGADCIATGHYAQTVRHLHKNKLNYLLTVSSDKNKDQTYFLWTLKKDRLPFILFPVGKYKKHMVRDIARNLKLPNANKKDSQGLCFIGNIDIKKYISTRVKVSGGSVLNLKGDIIGSHDGAQLYTIGERHGFRIFDNIGRVKPLYVISKDIKSNTITVSGRSLTENAISDVLINRVNWINGVPPSPKKTYRCRYRYRNILQKCRISQDKNSYRVHFNKPQWFIPSGQSLVIYDGIICFGGGIIV